jgi:hypothetical protein
MGGKVRGKTERDGEAWLLGNPDKNGGRRRCFKICKDFQTWDV